MKLKGAIHGLFLLLSISLVIQSPAFATSIDINPVRIFFDAKAKTEKLVVKNAGENDLTLQLAVFRWSADPEGNDVYEKTGDIILFPKILTLKKSEEKLVRIGTKTEAGASEKAYRIYLEELPVHVSLSKGATVHILMKVGVPLFISPSRPDVRGKIESAVLKNGKAEVRIKNDGNVHFSVQSTVFKGKDQKGNELFSKDVGGWYVLSGASRTYSTAIPKEVCMRTANIHIEVRTDNFTLEGKLDVDKSMCSP